jgi:hypothetical protein
LNAGKPRDLSRESLTAGHEEITDVKARFAGQCPRCDTEIEPGQEVSKLLGNWLHMMCKSAEIAARKQDFGPPVELPTEDLHNETITYIGVRSERRRSLKHLRDMNRH